MITPACTLALGTMVGPYRVVRPIGAGGMGEVYEAVHVRLDKRVALKVLNPEFARNPEARARFLREGQAAARIHHPHVAEVFDVGQHAGAFYLVIELLSGESMAAYLARAAPLAVDHAVDLLLPVIAALGAAHDAGIVHRDVKPENVFLARTPHSAVHPKLLDFGVSKVLTGDVAALTATNTPLGTPFYMSPEQVRSGRRVDARSDQYALGVVLYQCLTGRRPFLRDDLYALLIAIVEADYPAPRSLRPDLPPALEAVVLRAMAPAPDARFPNVHALGRALLPFASAAAQGLWSPVFGDTATLPLGRPGLAPVALPVPAEVSTLGDSVRTVPVARTLAPARTVTFGLVLAAVGTAALVTIAVFLPSRGTAPGAVHARVAPPPARAVTPASAPSPPRISAQPRPAPGAAVADASIGDAPHPTPVVARLPSPPRPVLRARPAVRAAPAPPGPPSGSRRAATTQGANESPIVE